MDQDDSRTFSLAEVERLRDEMVQEAYACASVVNPAASLDAARIEAMDPEEVLLEAQRRGRI